MTCFANGSAVGLYYCQEEADGSLPVSPVFKPVRFVSAGFSPQTTQVGSEEIRPDRQEPKARQGNYSTLGNIAGELPYTAHDDLFLAAMMGAAWEAGASLIAITLSAAAADDSFNDSGNGFITAGFKVGDVITTSGFTGSVANNGTWLIATVAAGKITVTNLDGTPATTIVDDAAGESVTIACQFEDLRIGTTRRTFAFMERHTDKNLDYLYRGCEVNGFTANFPLGANVSMTFPVIGKEAERLTSLPVGATFAARGDTLPMVTTEGSLVEDGDTIGYATEFNATLTNNMAANFALFSRAAYCISVGKAQVSGNLVAYLTDGLLYDKFLAETDTNIRVRIGNFTDGMYEFFLPDVSYTQGTKETANPGAILPNLTISAGYDSVEETTLLMRRYAP